MSHKNPIIFNDWSIQRILAGEKTQTRRIVKPQPAGEVDSIRHVKGRFWQANEMCSEWEPILWQEKCPYGQPGDVLWVREAFRMPVGCDDKYTPKEYVSSSGYTHGVPGRFRYEADGKRAYEVAGNRDACAVEWGRKRPPIHMPRELCRLRLRVEDVRVERVQEIGFEESLAEGMPYPHDPGVMPKGIGSVELDGQRRTIHELAFKALWNDIHGEGAWESNDWVWVIKFSLYDE
jgi:hypothetical protein